MDNESEIKQDQHTLKRQKTENEIKWKAQSKSPMNTGFITKVFG